MAQIGCLGDAVFVASRSKTLTVSSMTWSGSANISEHNLVGGNTLAEFTGNASEKMELQIIQSENVGVTPMDVLAKLWTYKRSGEAATLVLGDHAYGRYKWLIKDIKIKAKYFDGAGNITHATVTLSLVEYLN
ncbi:MAG: phage tail protein [Oscillospiraceae bacterium]|nr:phage tail protein [Oscillospiraceae bacterium]